MRKLIFILIGLFVIYLGIQVLFAYFGEGHNISYDVKYNNGVAIVNEEFLANNKERDSYYLNVNLGQEIFNFQVFEDFGKSSHILKKIEYFSNSEMTCILPIFRDNKLLFDVMCEKDNVVIPLSNMTDISDDLNTFISSLKDYDKNNFFDDKEKTKVSGPLTVYSNNLVSNHYLIVNNYKGLYNINSKNNIKAIDIFENDVYKQNINGFTGNAYVVADYKSVNDFIKIYYSDFEKGGYNNLLFKNEVSFNSYVQGSIGDSIYVFDRTNKKQYEINTKTLNILEVGNFDTGIKYYDNGEWTRIDIPSDDIFFGSNYKNDYVNDEYDRIVRYGNNSGYYYLYKKVGKSYEVYRADIYNKEYITYLFTTTDIDNVKYFDGFVYYSDGNEVKYYSDKTGNKTVLVNSEFKFNDTLIWGVYEKIK